MIEILIFNENCHYTKKMHLKIVFFKSSEWLHFPWKQIWFLQVIVHFARRFWKNREGKYRNKFVSLVQIVNLKSKFIQLKVNLSTHVFSNFNIITNRQNSTVVLACVVKAGRLLVRLPGPVTRKTRKEKLHWWSVLTEGCNVTVNARWCSAIGQFMWQKQQQQHLLLCSQIHKSMLRWCC